MAFTGTQLVYISDNMSCRHHANRCSETALNIAVKSIAVDFADQGIVTVAFHPSSAVTEARKASQITLTDSVTSLRAEVDATTQARSDTVHRYDSGTVEW